MNFTAGLPIVRTSADHGTAYELAGKNCANPMSMKCAIYSAIDIVRNRLAYKEMRKDVMVTEDPIAAKSERGPV